ncbi:hypothetical protein Poli38472_010448 [Pythium oligandrum]|uniref:RWP-RK domain-containing protein n=1 Tax=Pythium oligandrum TaxID=41045 RepID=A0A8K1C321_PYTOL|nr:hypothetical protein Poli38472_010448 [Pythium oligandrum]|eukprot:TMW55566.1 hypothetical protein Poli38472_010448 [Pythium oligandrum]
MKVTTSSIRALLGNDSDDGHREVAPTVWQEDFSRIHDDVKSAVSPRDTVEKEGSTDKTHQWTHTRMDGARPITNASREINFTMLQEHFHKPLRDAAQHFGICTTLLKKICRKNGITSWPYRQIIGLEKSISSMEQQVQYFDGEQRRQYAEQLNKLQRRLVSYERTGQPPRDDEMNASVVLQSLPSMSNATRTEKSSSQRQESVAAVMPEPVSTNGFRTKPEPSTPSPVGSASVRPLPSIAFILNGETHSEDSQ